MKDEMTETPQEASAKELRDLAEAALFTAQRDVALADMEVRKHEARKAAAHALSAELGAESMRVQTEATLRTEKLALASNHYHHVYDFVESVTADSVETCLAQLAIWDRLDPTCDMHIVMDSPGGSVIDGLHLFDAILAYSKRPWDTDDRLPRGTHRTKMTVRGYAASMGGILLQAADERVCGRHSVLMVHQVSSYAAGKIGTLKDEIKFLDKISDDVTNIFVNRSGGKITKEKFEKLWDRQDWWLTSQEALDYGLVDKLG
jgi:ATP-dependent protease ClpP protease subunit